MNCEQNLVILRINKRCVEDCLAQTPLYFVEQFVYICSAIKPLSIGTLARKNYLPTQNVIESFFIQKKSGISAKQLLASNVRFGLNIYDLIII